MIYCQCNPGTASQSLPARRVYDQTLTPRNDGCLSVDQRSDVVRVVLEGPGPEPLPVLLLHSGRQELKLDDRPLRRPSDQAALVLSNQFNSISFTVLTPFLVPAPNKILLELESKIMTPS